MRATPARPLVTARAQCHSCVLQLTARHLIEAIEVYVWPMWAWQGMPLSTGRFLLMVEDNSPPGTTSGGRSGRSERPPSEGSRWPATASWGLCEAGPPARRRVRLAGLARVRPNRTPQMRTTVCGIGRKAAPRLTDVPRHARTHRESERESLCV